MTISELQIEKVLERLLTGESAQAVAKDFPGQEQDVLAYAKTVKEFSNFKGNNPNKNGLLQALQSARALETKPEATPSPFAFVQFTRTSFLYRGVFVLPILFIVLIAGGAYLIPKGGVGSLPPMATNSAALNPQAATFSMESAGTGDISRAMKTMALSPVEPPMLPKDTTLASIYGPELSHDNQAVKEDSLQAQSASDDTSGTQGYVNAYDDKAF